MAAPDQSVYALADSVWGERMELPTLRESTCQKQVAEFRGRLGRLSQMTAAERDKLHEEMQAFVESLSMTNNLVVGAGVGLGAAVLPVIGWITGPLIGGIYCGYRSHQLGKYRDEVTEMLKLLAR